MELYKFPLNSSNDFIEECWKELIFDIEKPEVDKVLVFDNEPRNKEVVNLMQSAINKGHKVVIWPDIIKEKDVNAMVMSGMSKKSIEEVIESNISSGIAAQTKFVYWKKI